jgi:hypothetical protein
MTLNGRRVNCYCLVYRCQGKEVDWRTRESHKNKDRANCPLFPVHVEDPSQDEHMNQEPEELPDPRAPPVPYGEMPGDDFVSHIHALPNCNEPVFETVHTLCHDCFEFDAFLPRYYT